MTSPERWALSITVRIISMSDVKWLDRWCGRPLHLYQTIFEGARPVFRHAFCCETACAGRWTSWSPWILGLVPTFWSLEGHIEGTVVQDKVCVCHGPMVGSGPRHVVWHADVQQRH